jgi:bacteriocin-like protein
MEHEREQAEDQLTDTELQNVVGGALGKIVTRGLGVITSVGGVVYSASKLGVKKAVLTVTKGEKSATSDADIKKTVDDAIGPL